MLIDCAADEKKEADDQQHLRQVVEVVVELVVVTINIIITITIACHCWSAACWWWCWKFNLVCSRDHLRLLRTTRVHQF